MLVRKGTYKDFIAQFCGSNLVVNIKDQIRRLLFFLCEWLKKSLEWKRYVKLYECSA